MDLDSHKMQAFLENVAFLREQGMTDEQVARRLGVSKQLLEKRLERSRENPE